MIKCKTLKRDIHGSVSKISRRGLTCAFLQMVILKKTLLVLRYDWTSFEVGYFLQFLPCLSMHFNGRPTVKWSISSGFNLRNKGFISLPFVLISCALWNGMHCNNFWHRHVIKGIPSTRWVIIGCYLSRYWLCCKNLLLSVPLRWWMSPIGYVLYRKSMIKNSFAICSIVRRSCFSPTLITIHYCAPFSSCMVENFFMIKVCSYLGFPFISVHYCLLQQRWRGKCWLQWVFKRPSPLEHLLPDIKRLLQHSPSLMVEISRTTL